MSTQILTTASIVAVDVYNRPYLKSPDEQLQSVSLQAPGSFFEAEKCFHIQPTEKEAFNDKQRQAFDKELGFLGLLLKTNDLSIYKHSMRVKGFVHLFLDVLDLTRDDAMI